MAVDRYDSRDGHDDYTQAGNLYRLMPADERERLHQVIAGALGQTRPDIQMRQLCHFFRADVDYGWGVAKALGLDMTEVESRLTDAMALV